MRVGFAQLVYYEKEFTICKALQSAPATEFVKNMCKYDYHSWCDYFNFFREDELRHSQLLEIHRVF